MLEAMRRAAAQMREPAFRSVLLKSAGLTLLLFAGLGFGAFWGLDALTPHLAGWLKRLAEIVAGLGVVLLSVLLAMPVAALFVGIFLDDVVDAVEKKHYPNAQHDRAPGFITVMGNALGFALLVLVLNLVALPLYLLPGPNIVLFILLNAYLIGREYFELVALRHMSLGEARALRRNNRWAVLGAGVIIALALSVPIINVLAPLFGAAFMVHLFHGLLERDAYAP